MKRDLTKIYIDRLKDDHIEKIDETLEPSFLDIQEKDLMLTTPVSISGSAYLANEHLVLDLKITAQLELPCTICNKFAPFPVEIATGAFTVPIEEIKGAIYDFSDDVRSQILLKAPPFLECNSGQCPERKDINKYFKKPNNTPFSDLSL